MYVETLVRLEIRVPIHILYIGVFEREKFLALVLVFFFFRYDVRFFSPSICLLLFFLHLE